MQRSAREVLVHQQCDQVLKVDGILNQQNLRSTTATRWRASTSRTVATASWLRGGLATCARAGIDPLLYRSSGDAAVTPRGLPRFELVAINHQLHRPHRKPEHAGHFQSGVVVLDQRRWWCFFRFHELRIFLFFHSREKNLHLIQMIDMI